MDSLSSLPYIKKTQL